MLSAVCALAAAFLIQSFSASLQKSATFDEPIHIAAGLSYIETGRIVVNTEHPPLLKEMSGLSLRATGVRWPSTGDAAALMNGDLSLGSSVARSIIIDNGPDDVMFWARLPLIFVSTALVILVFLLGRRLVGDRAAIGAAFLCAFDPNLLAHSYLVTTDVGLTTFVLLFVLTLWDFVNRFGARRAIWCGLALGAALGAKFSAVILPPLAAALMGAAVIWPPAATMSESGAHPDAGNAATAARWRRVLRYALGFAAMCAIAFLVLQLIYLVPHDPLAYWHGWRGVYWNAVAGFQSYMAGRLAPRFYSYYLVAYLLKEPAASIVLAAIGLGIVITTRSISALTRAFLLLPPTLLLVGYSVMSFDIGIRYVIPALPFMHLLGGVALSRMFQVARARWPRYAAALLAAWVLVAAAGIYPDHLSYFNEAACILDQPAKVGLDGGTRCGPSWLDDSNVDWGQGLKQLKGWQDRNAPGQPIHLGYFGSMPPDAYGIKQIPMSNDELLNADKPGLYVVSSHIVASTPAVARKALGHGAEWLRRTAPTAIIGHALYVFDIRQPSPSDSGQIRRGSRDE